MVPTDQMVPRDVDGPALIISNAPRCGAAHDADASSESMGWLSEPK